MAFRVRLCCGVVASLVALFYFGNLGVMAWKVSDWWLVLACIFSLLAIVAFSGFFVLNELDCGKFLYKSLGALALCCGLLSVVNSTIQAIEDSKAFSPVADLYIRIETGTIPKVNTNARELLSKSVTSCSIGDYLKIHTAISSLTEIIYLGPVSSMIFGLAKPSTPKRPADCIEVYMQLIDLQPSLQVHISPSDQQTLRTRIKAREH